MSDCHHSLIWFKFTINKISLLRLLCKTSCNLHLVPSLLTIRRGKWSATPSLATSCCCLCEGDTSARDCRAVLATGRGSHPRLGQLLHSKCMTPTRRAHGGEESCGRWPIRPEWTGERPPDREALRCLWKRQRRLPEVVMLCVRCPNENMINPFWGTEVLRLLVGLRKWFTDLTE